MTDLKTSAGSRRLLLLLAVVLLALALSATTGINTPPRNATAADARKQVTPSTRTLPRVSSAELLRNTAPRSLFLRSSVALVLDNSEDVVLYERNADEQRPIASLTKLMTAIVCLDARLPLDEIVTITRQDRDRLRGSKSRLSYGTRLTRRDALYIALAASENRAANALARTYPGGMKAFVRAMNARAEEIGMHGTSFSDPTGLSSRNVSSARDLAALVEAASHYPLIREMTTRARGSVTDLRSGWKVEFFNTNRLVRRKDWKIHISKTGYIADAGNCLVMKTELSERPVTIILLNSWGKLSKFGDSSRIRKWLTESLARTGA